jgi:hypothetical protein
MVRGNNIIHELKGSRCDDGEYLEQNSSNLLQNRLRGLLWYLSFFIGRNALDDDDSAKMLLPGYSKHTVVKSISSGFHILVRVVILHLYPK